MRLPCTRATSVSARKLETFGSACVPQAEFECPQVRNPRSFPTGAFDNATGSAGFNGAAGSLLPQTPSPAADKGSASQMASSNPLKCRCMSGVFSEKGHDGVIGNSPFHRAA